MRLLRDVYEGPGSHGILRMAASMRDVRAVLRAFPDEGYFPALFGTRTRTGEPAPVSLSPLRGSEEGARTAGDLADDLTATVRRHPDAGAVVLVRSEAALLSGAPVPTLSLPENPEAERETRLVACEWESPGMGEHEAANLALESLVRAHAAPQERSPSPTVNVFGPPVLDPDAAAEYAEAERLLALFGVGVNSRVPLGASTGDLERLPRAWANVLLYREVGDAAALYLRDEFGTPRITTPMVGSAGTGAVLRSVGELCSVQKEVERAVWAELARTAKLPWYARLAAPETFRGRRVAIFGDFTHAVGLGFTLARELGLEVAPCGTYLRHLEREFLFHAHTFTDEAFVADDPEEVAARIESSNPDVVIGTHLEEEVADALDVPFLPLCPPASSQPFAERPLMGYSGSAVLADALEGALRRTKSKPRAPRPGLPWTEEALEGLEEIPAFLRGRARRLAEEHAREANSAEVTREILENSRS